MGVKLFIQAFGNIGDGLPAFVSPVILPAGTMRFGEGRLLAEILFVPMRIAGICMMLRNSVPLRKRLNARKREPLQRRVVALSAPMFVSAFIVAGLGILGGGSGIPVGLAHIVGDHAGLHPDRRKPHHERGKVLEEGL